MPGVERILLVSHAATTIALARALLGNRTLALRVGCCSLTEMKRLPGASDKVSGGWEGLKMADGAHLKEGASRDWGFEDIVIANGEVCGKSLSLVSRLEPGLRRSSQMPEYQALRMKSTILSGSRFPL
jgi:hypothetical protein